ncbi:phage tail protein [Leucobacter tenebrionis]|uniref:phage tail protein n=1 Tax=Leucobacter tenebrionis TaxID=2873270 RepID=UPI001CA7B3C9|nr:tape measure protein [Leucobacter tenebrionis]QZY52925.1 tape measure protein [Leucobacter tenebrionis]
MSSQVGAGHVAIFPTMRGFKGQVVRGVKGAGAAASAGFASSMKGAGAAAGTRLGRDMKNALKSSAGDLGAAATSKLNREVTAASAGLSKARLKQQDEAGKVRVAEARLREAVAKSGAESARAIAAEERLATARRSHKTATDQVAAATARLKGAQDAVKAAASASATSSWWGRLGASASNGLRSMVSGAASMGARAGQALGAAFKGAATVGVTGAAAALGIAFSAGFSRLTALDTARAKLTGLGHDGTTVAKVMQNATASVKGTAFGLGEAANVAAGAMAAQIKPGRALESHLKRVANNAAAAGVSMDEMGSIFNKAATQANGVQNDVIGMLADKGIPIYQELAKELGVTAGEVFKMASEGKVDFETFSKAAEAAAGTVADQIGKTVPGAWKNMIASLGRSGANIFGGIDKETGEMYGLYAKLGPLIASVTSVLGTFEDRAAGIGAVLDRTLGPGIDRLTELLNKIGSGSEDVKSKLSGLIPVLAPVGAAFAALGSGGLATLLARIPLLGGLLGGLTGPLALLGGPLGVAAAAFAGFALSGGDAGAVVASITGIVEQVVAALPGMILEVARFVPQLVESILAQLPALMNAAVSIVNALVEGIVQSIPLLVSGAIVLLNGLIDTILANLPVIVSGAINLVTALLDGIISALPVLIEGAVQLVTALLQGIISALPQLIDGALRLVQSLLTAIIGALPQIIEGGIQLLLALVQGLIEALPQLIEAALQLVMGLLTAIVENLPLIIEGGIQLLLSLVQGLIEALPQLITAAIELVLQLIAGLIEMLPQLIEAGIQLVVALIEGLLAAIPQIIEMLPQIISAIWDGLMGVDWLDLGAQIVMGIINGLASMGQALLDAIIELASSAFEGFKDFFGIASPAKRMMQPGRDVVRGAVAGVDDEAPALGDSLVGMAEGAARRARSAMTSASTQVAATVNASTAQAPGDGGGRAPAHIEQHNNFAHEDPQVAASLAQQQLDGMVRAAL